MKSETEEDIPAMDEKEAAKLQKEQEKAAEKAEKQVSEMLWAH